MYRFDFFIVVLIDVVVATFQLHDAVADCHGRLREVVPLRLNSFFQGISLAVTGFGKVIQKFKQVARLRNALRSRYRNVQEQPGDHEAKNGHQKILLIVIGIVRPRQQSTLNGLHRLAEQSD